MAARGTKNPNESRSFNHLQVVGWREWVGLPGFGVPWLKAKVDTGARSSALHADEIEEFDRDGQTWVRFVVHPWQRSDADPTEVSAPLFEHRTVRSSNGATEDRPVIRTSLGVGEVEIPIELTLTRREQMGFRLLIGRRSLRSRFVVDPDRSFLTGRPPRAVLRANGRRGQR